MKYFVIDFRLPRRMRSSLFWHVTQRSLAVRYRRFVTAYWSHLQSSSLSKPLKFEPTGSLETLVIS